ncbi:myeloid cell surface antigen CD33-like [Piliocolobus tephrosceles]|uniref:myeloid cell surface antigen CD33-like n=1 Tax=Piliocolobus tephrosceles TaxID=591936 RepID=UPI000E6B2EAA|nr:myeloid cell surface antigen CD33-like [Piliocolobus tephrosceles]
MGVSLLHLGSSTFGSLVLMITPQPQDHSTKLTWLVKFPGVGVTTERTIQLSVFYAPRYPRIGVSLGDGTGERCPRDQEEMWGVQGTQR